MLLLRFIEGMGAVHVFTFQVLTVVTPPASRFEYFLSWETACLVSTGLGSLTSSVAHAWLSTHPLIPRHTRSPVCLCGVLTMLALAICFFPPTRGAVFHATVAISPKLLKRKKYARFDVAGRGTAGLETAKNRQSVAKCRFDIFQNELSEFGFLNIFGKFEAFLTTWRWVK